MFEELLRKQVCCYKNGKLDNTAMSCLRIMYPLFKVVSSEFDIHPDEPFIWIGDIKWTYKLQKYKQPYIIGATTGEYDLTDRTTLIQLAYLKYNKEVPKYLQEMDIENNWDLNQFMTNWKYIWLLGSPLDKIKEQNNTFIEIINHLHEPIRLLEIYSDTMNAYGEDTFKYLENAMISFIHKSKDMTIDNTKSKKMVELRSMFITSNSKNITHAVWNLTHSTIDYQPLRFLNFLLDLVWADRGEITNDRR